MAQTVTATPETGHSLISSHDVTGTAVHSPTGDHVGDIDHLMIDKQTGKIAYAVMSFGGFLGMGEEHTPIPWGKLRYDVTLGGYVTDITKEQLEGLPRLEPQSHMDRRWEEQAHAHFGMPYYWI